MPRPTKRGLDYFPLDVNRDKKSKTLVRKFGIVGDGIYTNLLRSIYEEGYFLEIDGDFIEDFCIDLDIDESVFHGVLDFLLRKKFFDPELFENHKILTSAGIQKRFLEATKRRTEYNCIQKYHLIEVSVSNNSVNANNNPQSKVKKSKVKKSPLNPPGGNGVEEFEKESLENLFLEFWRHCPKKVYQDSARKAFLKVAESGVHPICLIEAMQAQVAVGHWNNAEGVSMPPAPKKWIDGGCWKDELKPSEKIKSTGMFKTKIIKNYFPSLEINQNTEIGRIRARICSRIQSLLDGQGNLLTPVTEAEKSEFWRIWNSNEHKTEEIEEQFAPYLGVYQQ